MLKCLQNFAFWSTVHEVSSCYTSIGKKIVSLCNVLSSISLSHWIEICQFDWSLQNSIKLCPSFLFFFLLFLVSLTFVFTLSFCSVSFEFYFIFLVICERLNYCLENFKQVFHSYDQYRADFICDKSQISFLNFLYQYPVFQEPYVEETLFLPIKFF